VTYDPSTAAGQLFSAREAAVAAVKKHTAGNPAVAVGTIRAATSGQLSEVAPSDLHDLHVQATTAIKRALGLLPAVPVRKALTARTVAVPADVVAIYDNRRGLLGIAPASRVSKSFKVIKARQAKGDPLVACYDVNGSLVGVCNPDDLIGLAKGERWSYDNTGAVVGIISAAGKLTPVASAKAKAAVGAAAGNPTPPDERATKSQSIPAAWEVDAERRIQARLGAVKKGLKTPSLTLGETNLLRRWLASGMRFTPSMKSMYQGWLDGR
jgi:hypothetical protein